MLIKWNEGVRIKLIILLSIFLSSICQASDHRDILLSPSKVKLLLEQNSIVLVDSRPLFQFKKQHIQGAVSLPTDETFYKIGRSDLVATIFDIRNLMREAGIKKESKVVVYGNKNIMDISRLFWVFEMFGLEGVGILDGGLADWKKLNYATETGVKVVAPSEIFPQLNEKRLATMLMTYIAITDKEQVIVDARTKEEYDGLRSATEKFGHITSAISVPWRQNTTENYERFRSIEQLQALYKGVGKKTVTVYCNKGKESAVNYVALRLIGADVRAYDGSWFEWSMPEGMPISMP